MTDEVLNIEDFKGPRSYIIHGLPVVEPMIERDDEGKFVNFPDNFNYQACISISMGEFGEPMFPNQKYFVIYGETPGDIANKIGEMLNSAAEQIENAKRQSGLVKPATIHDLDAIRKMGGLKGNEP